MAHYRENMATARNTTQSLRIAAPWYTTTIQFFTSNFSVNFSIQTTSRPHPDCIQTASRPHPGSLDSPEFICSGFIGELSPVYCCLVDCFFFFWKFVTKLLILRAKICNDYNDYSQRRCWAAALSPGLKQTLSSMKRIIKLHAVAVARKQAEDNNDRKLSEKTGTESDRIIISAKKKPIAMESSASS